MQHIVHGTTYSPYVSLTRSYGVAEAYARAAGLIAPTARKPGYIYVIELTCPLPVGLTLLDPIFEVASRAVPPESGHVYQHDGTQDFLLGVVDPSGHGAYMSANRPVPPGSVATAQPAHLSIELETLVRALRDAEILAIGAIPGSNVTNRFDVH
jgi:hypothetical protein